MHPTVCIGFAFVGVLYGACFGSVGYVPRGEHLVAYFGSRCTVVKNSNRDGVFDFRRIPCGIVACSASSEESKGYQIKKLVKIFHFIFPSFY